MDIKVSKSKEKKIVSRQKGWGGGKANLEPRVSGQRATGTREPISK